MSGNTNISNCPEWIDLPSRNDGRTMRRAAKMLTRFGDFALEAAHGDKLTASNNMAMMWPDMSESIVVGIKALFNAAASVRIPQAWFRTIPNHTAVVLLADILSSYLNIPEQEGQNDRVMDGDELLLDYKPLAKKLGLSDRSVSRGIDYLVQMRALQRSRKDRKINGRVTRNVVGVVPNLKVIAKFTGVRLDDSLSSRKMTSAASRTGRGVTPPIMMPDNDEVLLTDSQESIINAYKRHFEEIIGSRYQTTAQQHQTDLTEVAKIQIPKHRGGGLNYLYWSRQYIEKLKEVSDAEHGEGFPSAFDRQGHVVGRFSIESYASWALSDETLPGGSRRRRFR